MEDKHAKTGGTAGKKQVLVVNLGCRLTDRGGREECLCPLVGGTAVGSEEWAIVNVKINAG